MEKKKKKVSLKSNCPLFYLKFLHRKRPWKYRKTEQCSTSCLIMPMRGIVRASNGNKCSQMFFQLFGLLLFIYSNTVSRWTNLKIGVVSFVISIEFLKKIGLGCFREEKVWDLWGYLRINSFFCKKKRGYKWSWKYSRGHREAKLMLAIADTWGTSNLLIILPHLQEKFTYCILSEAFQYIMN